MNNDTSQAWAHVIAVTQIKRPLMSHWVQAGTQLAHINSTVIVGFPPSESHSLTSLQRHATLCWLESTLSAYIGEPTNLVLSHSSFLPDPQVGGEAFEVSLEDAAKIEARVLQLNTEFWAHSNELQVKQPNMVNIPEVYRCWSMQKLASLQLLVEAFAGKISKLEYQQRP